MFIFISGKNQLLMSLHIATVNKPIIKQILHKDLGINFTNDLQWNKHYIAITTKAYQTLGLIRRTFNHISIIASKQLYISLVHSQLVCCSPLWRPQLLKDIFTLERIQHRATKFILNNYVRYTYLIRHVELI